MNLLCFSHKVLISTAISSYIAYKYCKFCLSLPLEEDLNGIYHIFNSQFKVLSFSKHLLRPRQAHGQKP